MSRMQLKHLSAGFMALFLCGLSSLYPRTLFADHLIQTEKHYYLFSERTGDLLKIGTGGCPATGQIETNSPPLIGFSLPDGDPLQERFNHLSYGIEKEEKTGTHHTLVFLSSPLTPGLSFKKTYRIGKKNHFVDVSLSLLGPESASFSNNTALTVVLNPVDGWDLSAATGSSEERRMVFVGERESLTESEFRKRPSPTLAQGEWAGFRDRFSAVLIKPDIPLTAMDETLPDRSAPPRLTFKTLSALTTVSMRLYTGPVDWFSFGEEKKTLSFLLYDALWFWVRWISFGLFFLLYGLIQISGSHGLSILLLSLAVKGMMLPLVRVSDQWQNDVNKKRSLIEPREKEIKSRYKGHEQHQRILALYKELDIHPMYALKTFLSCFIQIPIFFAAYHALSENVWLKGVSFLWITDLTRPDHFYRLPVDLFYFGGYVNLLPLLMTAITVVTAALFQDPILSEAQLKKQKMNLYLMAAAFFLLFYPFPAGMVLYWTMNNLLALIKELVRKIFGRGRLITSVGEVS